MLGSLILYFKGMRIMFQLSGFYCKGFTATQPQLHIHPTGNKSSHPKDGTKIQVISERSGVQRLLQARKG